MVRIKTICKTGTEFLSPFVLTEEQAERKIKSVSKWHKWRDYPKFEIVSVEKFHPSTVWKEHHPIFDGFIYDQIGMIKQLEKKWEKEEVI